MTSDFHDTFVYKCAFFEGRQYSLLYSMIYRLYCVMFYVMNLHGPGESQTRNITIPRGIV